MKILRNKSGVSLIFVLAVMLMLLAIGVSALTAASLNFGAGLAQRERSQANLYAGSMQQTVRAALETGKLFDIIIYEALENPDFKERRLYTNVYSKNDNDALLAIDMYTSGEHGFSEKLGVNLSAVSLPGGPVYEIIVSGVVSITAPEPIISTEYKDGILIFSDRTLQTVTVNGKVTVRQTTDYKQNEITTETTYRLEGCVLKEIADDDDDSDATDSTVPLNLEIKNPGGWIFEKHETIDEPSE